MTDSPNGNLARIQADAASALAKLRREIEYLRAGLRDLVEDDTRSGREVQDVAQAILNGKFRREATAWEPLPQEPHRAD